MSFPPEVFARIQPDVFLQRHLELGLRPGDLRRFDEFRPHLVNLGGLSKDASVIGSAVARQGGTSVVCGVTFSYTEDIEAKGEVYPNVEVLRGSTLAPPTQEEMTLSERLRMLVKSLEIEKEQKALQITDEREEDGRSKTYYLILNAHIQVLSRSGPCFDICANSLLAALRDVKLPKVYIDVDNGTVKIDSAIATSLELSYDAAVDKWPAKSFAVWKNQIIADLEGDAEETVLGSTSEISYVATGTAEERQFKNLTIRGACSGYGELTKEVILQALREQ